MSESILLYFIFPRYCQIFQLIKIKRVKSRNMRSCDSLSLGVTVITHRAWCRPLERSTIYAVGGSSTIPQKCSIVTDDKEIQQVESYSYLGSLTTSDGKSDRDINQRICNAKPVFGDMKHHVLLSTRNCRINLTIRLYGFYTDVSGQL